MYGIGQFAQIAKVSVRTLRHYDDVGLLRPAAVDPHSGYRSYEALQLRSLNRILALKDLGFTLAEITPMMESGVSADELLGMLKLRRAEAERNAEAERQRLSRVAARIDLLTGEPFMQDVDIIVKPLDAVRVAVVGEPADGFDVEFGPIFGRLYPALFAGLAEAGIPPAGPTYGLYDARDDGQIEVMAGVVVAPDAELPEGADAVTLRDLPGAARAVTLIHHGPMSRITKSYAAIDQWLQSTAETPDGFSREVYLDCPEDEDDWVTELQFVLK